MIVDAHNDLLLEPCAAARLFERYWLRRLVAGGVGVQICPLVEELPPAFARWA